MTTINICLLLIVGIIFIVLFLKKYPMQEYYNYSTEELINLKKQKWSEYDFATYTERLELIKEIEKINEELDNRCPNYYD